LGFRHHLDGGILGVMVHVRRWAAASGLVALAIALACGASSLKGAGEVCVASSECGVGLLCDLGQSPPVCSSSSSLVDAPPVQELDASEEVDAAVDAPPPPDAAVDAPPDAPDEP
jgi:hypothetical protein